MTLSLVISLGLFLVFAVELARLRARNAKWHLPAFFVIGFLLLRMTELGVRSGRLQLTEAERPLSIVAFIFLIAAVVGIARARRRLLLG